MLEFRPGSPPAAGWVEQAALEVNGSFKSTRLIHSLSTAHRVGASGRVGEAQGPGRPSQLSFGHLPIPRPLPVKSWAE